MLTKIILLTILIFSANVSSANFFSSFPYWDNLVQKFEFIKNKQSFCYRDAEGKTKGVNTDIRIRPASVTKLYVTLWALDKLTPNHRFSTNFIYNDKKLYILGGADPFFVSESMLYIMNKLNDAGINHIEEVYFDKNFYFNWQDQAEKVRAKLKKYLNTRNWSKSIVNEFKKIQNRSAHIVKLKRPVLRADKVIMISDLNYPNETSLWKLNFQSSPLYQHLKQMNVYSNNFMAQKYFDYMGGQVSFHLYMEATLSINTQDTFFYTGSGLGENYTTCNTNLRVLAKLNDLIEKSKLSLSQVISVPSVDLGTLRRRFKEEKYKSTLWAKTGTLRHTSALAGFLNSHAGLVPFGIFNHTYESSQARIFQEKIVHNIFDTESMPEKFEYQRIQYNPLSDIIVDSIF